MNMLLLRNVRSFTTKCTINSQQTEHFNELAKIWWDADGVLKPLHALNNFRVPWIINRLSKIGAIKSKEIDISLTGLSVLDIGCGGGILTESLARLGGNLTGVDCNTEMLKIAQSRAQEQSLSNIQYIQSTIEEHSLDNREKYDVVVASETIEHVDAQDLFVKCCVECLKPGGSIFFTTNSKSRISEFVFITMWEDILRCIPKGSHKYDMFIDVEDLKKLLEKENCKIFFTSGLVYNPLKSKWIMIRNHYILHYILHAVKLPKSE